MFNISLLDVLFFLMISRSELQLCDWKQDIQEKWAIEGDVVAN